MKISGSIAAGIVAAALAVAAVPAEAEDAFPALPACQEGVQRLPAQAAETLKVCQQAAEQGNAVAQNLLGDLYAHGDGIENDDATTAITWYKKAAQQGNVDAQYSLGAMYAQGAGIARDEIEAVKWYKKAARQGHADAQEALRQIGKPSRENTAKVLETFTAGPVQYQLAVAPCIWKPSEKWMECPLAVRLLKNGKRLDEKTLPQGADNQRFERKPLDEYWPKDLSDASPRLHVWASGYETAYIGVLARTVPLDATHTGFLVTQQSGYEVIRYDHVLYAEEKGKLKQLWSFSDSPSGQWVGSAVYPIVRQGRNYLLFWQYMAGHAGDDGAAQPDSYQINLLHWLVEKNSMETLPLPAQGIPLYLVATGFYPDAGQAGKAAQKIKEEDCKDQGVWIYTLATENYPKLDRQEKALVGGLFFTRKGAEEFQQELAHCTRATDSKLFILD